MRRRSALLALAAGGALLLSACSSPAPAASPSASPTGERTLVVYSGRDKALIDPLIADFQTASGIKVETRYAGSTELAGQLLEEGANSPAQVFLSQDAGALGAVGEAGLLQTLPAEIAGKVPAQYTSSDASWVGLTGRARVAVYDSQKHKAADVPGDVTKFTEAKWKGKVGIAPSNASFQAFVTAMRVNDGEDAAKKWLDGLVANDVKKFESNGDILEAVNSGTLEIGLINHYYWARSEQDPTKLRAQLKFGDAGTTSALVNVTGAGVLKAKASPEATEFVTWLLGEQAQEYFLTKTYEYPLVGDKGPANVPPLKDLGGPSIDLSKLSSLKETVALITQAGLL